MKSSQRKGDEKHSKVIRKREYEVIKKGKKRDTQPVEEQEEENY